MTKEKEFNLSERIIEGNLKFASDLIYKRDVKEFILEESELLTLLESGQYTWDEFHEKRRKLTGDLK